MGDTTSATSDSIDARLAATVAKWCLARPGTFPGAHPVSLMREHLATLNADDPSLPLLTRMLVTEKTNGTRMMVMCCDAGSYFFDRNVVPFHHIGCALPPGTLLDGEWVSEQGSDGTVTKVYLVFDALCVAGFNYMRRPFWERLEAAKTILPTTMWGQTGESEVRLKQFYPLSALRTLVTKMIPALPYSCDGTIFSDMTTPYVVGRDLGQFKWKDPGCQTVDMRVHVDPVRFDDPHAAPPGADLMVYDGRRQIKYGRLANAAALTDGIIGEFLHVSGVPGVDAEWKFVKPRPDKSRANDVQTVVGVLAAAREAISLDELCEAIGQ